MLITQTISWTPISWPTITGLAGQYAVLRVYPDSSPVEVATVSENVAELTFDDSQNLVFQVRPSEGTGGPGSGSGETYGPEVAVFVIGYAPCRAWLRQKIRNSLQDRTDTGSATLTWPDDEINGHIQEGINELNVVFPTEQETVIQLLPPAVDGLGNQLGVRSYALPADCQSVELATYYALGETYSRVLKMKPMKGGETTATSWAGYPKFGILVQPTTGRFYGGNYDVWNGQMLIDWDPVGNGDYIRLRYNQTRAIPVGDADILALTLPDMELINLYAQMKCYLRLEGSDVKLSRWKDTGARRDDTPTTKHSDALQKLYNQRLNDRREMRPRSYRLTRV